MINEKVENKVLKPTRGEWYLGNLLTELGQISTTITMMWVGLIIGAMHRSRYESVWPLGIGGRDLRIGQAIMLLVIALSFYLGRLRLAASGVEC